MTEDIINVNFEGKQREVKVLEIFEVKGYPDKQYILYVFPEEEEKDEESIAVQVSILNHSGDSYSLENIVDDQEFDDVSKAVSEIFEEE